MIKLNAQIVHFEVYGNGTMAADAWALIRVRATTSTSNTICTENVNTLKKASTAYAVVDNERYVYQIYITTPTSGGELYSALIAYTI